MSSNKCPLRPIGQRSITSTFLIRASSRSGDCESVEIKSPSQKSSRISLSEFLNRKLHRSSVLPSSVEGKEPSLSSPLGAGHLDRDVKAETKSLIDGAFDLFKNVDNGKNEARNSHSANETEIIDVDDLEQTRKRKVLFEGDGDEPTSRKRVVVLGGGSKPAKSSIRKNFAHGEPPALFNHYGNGGGWWNESMEGVDNEEVGSNEVWEGVGCTTLGGIEWH